MSTQAHHRFPAWTARTTAPLARVVTEREGRAGDGTVARPCNPVRPCHQCAKFFRHVRVAPNGCWIWTDPENRNPKNYPWWPAMGLFAHRWAYNHWKGPIPHGLECDHLCHTADLGCPGALACPHRLCVNPAHLEAVTSKVNQQRRTARITRCKWGHEYTPENTKWHGGTRECRQCDRNRKREWARQRRAA